MGADFISIVAAKCGVILKEIVVAAGSD